MNRKLFLLECECVVRLGAGVLAVQAGEPMDGAVRDGDLKSIEVRQRNWLLPIWRVRRPDLKCGRPARDTIMARCAQSVLRHIEYRVEGQRLIVGGREHVLVDKSILTAA